MPGSIIAQVSARPNFINIGPGRCASSWLLEVLESHPDISMARIKETEFFNTNFEKGVEWYQSLFPVNAGKAVGEISNCYYTEPAVSKRIYDFDSKMKIIVNVRDPFSLLKSFHGFGLRRGLELGELQDDLSFPIGRIMGSGFDQRQRLGMLNPGDTVSLLESVMLSKMLRPFFESFPREQIYVFIFERLRTERRQVLTELYEFLEVDIQHVPKVADEVVNASIKPKSKLLARIATSSAFFLRQAGAYKLLDSLKKSRVIKKMLYSKTVESASESTDPAAILSSNIRSQIYNDMKNMIELYPPLSKWWSPLLNRESQGGQYGV